MTNRSKMTPTLTLIAVCTAATMGSAYADSRNGGTAPTRLLGETGLVRSTLGRGAANASDDRDTLGERRADRDRLAERDAGNVRDRIAENREQRLEAREDDGRGALVGLEDTENGKIRELNLGRAKVALETAANKKGEDDDDQAASASGKVSVSTLPKDEDVKGSSVATGLTLKGPAPESDDNPIDDDSDEAGRVGGSAQTSLKLTTPDRDDKSETRSYGSSMKIGVNGVTTKPE